MAQSDSSVILRNALIDTDRAALAIPDHLRSHGDAGAYIVQAKGRIDDSFRKQLAAAGAEFVSYVPVNAYLVRISEAGPTQLAAMPRTLSVVPYEPYYKLSEPLIKTAFEQTPLTNQWLKVVGYPGSANETRLALAAAGHMVVQEQVTPFGMEFTISADPNSLVSLAQMPSTQNIEPFTPRRRTTDLARETLGVSTQLISTNYLNLSGSNVVVAVTDTGVDAFHPDLFPRVIQVPSPPAMPLDIDGHGTFMAGVIASSGQNPPSYTNVSGSVSNASYRGIASSASIFPLPIDLLNPFQPPFFYTDKEIQENIARSNIFIGNNSWGYFSFSYDTSSAIWDAAVRDSNPFRTSPKANPVVYVFAAGNEGFGDSTGVNGIGNTILSPANAKNVITVGATENMRQITNRFVIGAQTNSYFYQETDNEDQVTYFSARGNVGVGIEGEFGRYKPDVVAPGVNVLSSIPASHCKTPPCFAFFQGTSMATPHLAGSAAVVRGQHPTWSAAEVRSAVVNTAEQNVLKKFDTGTTAATDVNITGSGRENLLAAVGAVVALDPVSVSFGAIPAGSGQTKTFAVALKNLSGATMTLGVAVTAGDSSVSYAVSPAQVQLAPGATTTVTVTMSAAKAAAAGHHQGQLNITAGATSVAHAAVYTLIK